MYIKRFFQKLFCRCKVCKVPPLVATNIPQEDLISEAEIKKLKKVPDDQFTCHKCGIVPEILEIHSDTGNLTLNCNKHGIKPISTRKYLYSLRKSSFSYLKLKCANCNAEPSGKETKMQFCVLCRKPLCKTCCDTNHEEHRNSLISIREINNTCRIHKNEKTELYCLDCEEIICEYDMIHSDHRVIDTFNKQKEVNKYREIIIKKNQKLFSMRDFYKLVLQSGNKLDKEKVSESIKKEKNRNEYDVDLAIYYLKQHPKKEIIDIKSG